MSSDRQDVDGYDEVWRLDLGDTVAYLALHAVLAGRAFGGIRIRPYPDERAARDDALALASAMSRKVVLAGLHGGGGKTVMIAPSDEARAACVARLGDFIESLDGRYCCGPDFGFTADDDAVLRERTRWVACSGMSAATARSVRDTMLAVLPTTRKVAVQGLGAVGAPLANMLEARGIEVAATDVRPVADERKLVPPHAILDEEADVFAPCAAGGVLDAGAVDRLRVQLVCGGANNPFATDDDARRLHRRGIGYVPDVLSNCGAAIVGASTTLGETHLIESRLAAVGPLAREVCARAASEDRSSHEVVREIADERIAALREVDPRP
ncbi:MAG: hypothetical protein H6825_03175 [Planctomycetes bacterium]|nr:hypothetical protein [Planctomycetota bacterium]